MLSNSGPMKSFGCLAPLKAQFVLAELAWAWMLKMKRSVCAKKKIFELGL